MLLEKVILFTINDRIVFQLQTLSYLIFKINVKIVSKTRKHFIQVTLTSSYTLQGRGP